MVPLHEFKKALGVLAQQLSNEEIEHIRDEQDQLASVLFDSWLRETNSTRAIALEKQL